METFGRSDDLQGARFADTNLRGARFVGADLSGVVMRGVEVTGADIDAPWLLAGGGSLLVNGVDVTAYVDAELNRRFPGREQQRASDPEGLRAAWAALEQTWTATLSRVSGMPDGTVDVSVDEEWSFAQTLRHLVMATDMWLGRAVLGVAQPFHPLGFVDSGTEADGFDTSVFTPGTPSYDDVLDARASRVAMVRDFLATVTADELVAARQNPHDPQYPETTLSCLHTILEEEWEHHRYAVRDLDAIEAKPTEGHQHHHATASVEDYFEPAAWEERYSGEERVWSGRPNAQLVAEVSDLAPGTALDLGCGEGGDVIWLAQRGWQVTGADFSSSGLARAARHAEEAGVSDRVDWLEVDARTFSADGRSYDLVTTHYLHPPDQGMADVVRRLGEAVKPGGHLLVVGHAPSEAFAHLDDWQHRALFEAEDLVAGLPDDFEAVVVEQRSHPMVRDGVTHDVDDSTLLARRRP